MPIEEYYFVDSDAVSYQIAFTSSRVLLGLSGAGMADVEHFLQGVPSQQRYLHLGHKFKPRYLTFVIRDIASDRNTMWSHHQDWLSAFNPDKGQGYVRVILSDGTTERRLDCRYNDGLKFSSDDRIGPFLQGDIVQMVAENPFWYNPTQQSASGNFNGATPVDIAVNNAGHIGTYPVLTITGAVNTPRVTLVSTGEYVELSYNLTATHHFDVDCEEGTVLYDDATNEIDELTKESTLFYIPRGNQTLGLSATSGAGAFSCSFFNRFLGL